MDVSKWEGSFNKDIVVFEKQSNFLFFASVDVYDVKNSRRRFEIYELQLLLLFFVGKKIKWKSIGCLKTNIKNFVKYPVLKLVTLPFSTFQAVDHHIPDLEVTDDPPLLLLFKASAGKKFSRRDIN